MDFCRHGEETRHALPIVAIGLFRYLLWLDIAA